MPGEDAASDTLELAETLRAEELESLEGAHSASAMNVVGRGGVQLGGAVGQLAQGNEDGARDAGLAVLLGLAHVEDNDAERRVVEGALHFEDVDFVG